MELNVFEHQESDKICFDASAKTCDFNEGEAVFSRKNFGRYRWKPALILGRTGPVSYNIQVSNSVEHLHASQLRGRLPNMEHPSEEEIDRDLESAFDASWRQEQEQAAQLVAEVQKQAKPSLPIPQVQEAVQPVSLHANQVTKASGKAASSRRESRPAAAAVAAALQPPPKAALPLAARTLRPRENLHAPPRFADEYWKPGSSKT